MARYKIAEKQMEQLSNQAAQQPNEIRERRTAAEDTLGALESDIGKPGTYDVPGQGPGPGAPAPSDPSGGISGPTGLLSDTAQAPVTGGIFKQTTTAGGSTDTGPMAGGTKTTSLDKNEALKQYESSSAFRQVSRMMAESEQLLARQGPLYDEMMRSTQLPIIEASAAAARENTENIRQAMQRGGGARRDAFAAISKIRSQENLNMQRGQALAKAHLEMDKWARQNASEVITFANGWATNQAGIRESYNTAMDNASQLMSESAIPFMFASRQKEQEYRDAASAQRRGKVMRQISGVLGVATSVVGLVGSFYGQGGGSAAGAKMMEGGQVKSVASTGLPRNADSSSGNYFGAGGQ